MIIKKLVVGFLETNCYIIGCERTKKAFIVDPGAESSRIIEEVKKEHLNPEYIINTHGHGDHIGANENIKQEFEDLKILIHANDKDMLIDASKNLSADFAMNYVSPSADLVLNGGEIIEVGDLELEILFTPGHTPGGISIFIRKGKTVFTGDALFCGSVGRTDFPSGSGIDLIKGIKEKLMVLDSDVVIYPGHGPDSTIGKERESNPFLV
ncbi:MBL fold metallo-hydrolase [bacterium]|nr:MBL fold metallo-hydrolase [bacterium]